MKLIVVSAPGFFPGETSLINKLFEVGLSCLHLRKPLSSESDFNHFLSQIEPVFLSRIAIHQHHVYATDYGIKRLHFPENDRLQMSESGINKLVHQGYTLSTSIHNLSETSQLSEGFAYTFYGPVFNSISKPGYQGIISNDFCFENPMKKIKVIGLGGIQMNNLLRAMKMNFDGLGLLGAIWQDLPRAVDNFTSIQKAIHHTHDR